MARALPVKPNESSNFGFFLSVEASLLAPASPEASADSSWELPSLVIISSSGSPNLIGPNPIFFSISRKYYISEFHMHESIFVWEYFNFSYIFWMHDVFIHLKYWMYIFSYLICFFARSILYPPQTEYHIFGSFLFCKMWLCDKSNAVYREWIATWNAGPQHK